MIDGYWATGPSWRTDPPRRIVQVFQNKTCPEILLVSCIFDPGPYDLDEFKDYFGPIEEKTASQAEAQPAVPKEPSTH